MISSELSVPGTFCEEEAGRRQVAPYVGSICDELCQELFPAFVPTKYLNHVPTYAICTHMLNKTLKLRVSEEEVERWAVYAKEVGKGLSAWIRSCCNGSGPSTMRRMADLESKPTRRSTIEREHHPACKCTVCKPKL